MSAGLVSVVINPGSGPVAGASKKAAKANMKAFVGELKLKGLTFKRDKEHDRDGRYAFVLTRGDRAVEVDMPGLPLERVRYVVGLNPWDFPRLYVNGSSWLWQYAVDMAMDSFTSEED